MLLIRQCQRKHVKLQLQSRRHLDKSGKAMDNMAATKLLKSLYTEHQASPYPDNNEEHVRNAFHIFDSVHGDKNYFLVNSLLKCCIHFKQSYHGLVIWDEIKSIPHIDYSLIIKCCVHCHPSHPDRCLEILHSVNQFIKNNNIAIKSALITAFGQCSEMKTSWSIFNGIPNDHKNIITITAMMKCCINHHEGTAALQIYDEFNEIEPDIHNEVSRLLAIKACIESDEWDRGTQLIALNARYDQSLQFKTTQIEFYGHFGDIDSAFRVFHSIPNDQKDAICVGAMLKALVNAGYSEESLSLYDNSKYSHLTDDVSNVLAIKACINGHKESKGKAIIDLNYSVDGSIDFKRCSIEVLTAMIDFYGHFGDIDRAKAIFAEIRESDRNIICMNSMMNSLSDNGMNAETLELFNQLRRSKLRANNLSYAIVLKAATQGMAYYAGRQIHQELKEVRPRLLTDVSIQCCLISFYGKCGKLDICREIFDGIKRLEPDKFRKEIKIWNAMIHAFGRNGDIQEALKLYKELKAEKMVPSRKTYTVLLNACSHSGDIDTAYTRIWKKEIRDHALKYDEFVVTPLVDGMARKGRLKEVYDLILEIERETNDQRMASNLWMALLGGSKQHGDLTMANRTFSEMKNRYHDRKEYMASAAVLLSNTFASVGEFDEVDRIRNEMKNEQWKIVRGESEIDIYGSLHRFHAGDGFMKDERYRLVDEKLREMFTVMKRDHGFQHDYSVITRKLKHEEEMEYELQRHSEKLALVYGLLTLPSGEEIFINKNLRICKDCHEAMKMISKMENRQITIADNSRIHTFRDGQCSCHDYY